MEVNMKTSEHELTLIKVGYTSAMQDIYTEIMDATQQKNLGVDIDKKTVHLVEAAISQAFLKINEKFEEQTTLLFINTNQHGR